MIRPVAAVILLAVATAAYADQAETELRPKSAGVDDALRKEIVSSIRRGSRPSTAGASSSIRSSSSGNAASMLTPLRLT